MRPAHFPTGFRFHDEVALLANMLGQAVGGLAGSMPLPSRMSIDAVAEAGITFGCLRSGTRTAIPRMFSEGCVISSSRLFGAFSVDPSQNSRISSASHRRSFGHGALLGLAQRLDFIVEMIDQNPPVVVFHRSKQLGQHHRGIRRPVAVVAAVQFDPGTVDGNVHDADAAGAEDEQLPPGLVRGAVADQPDVA